jgi:hypothetical protein
VRLLKATPLHNAHIAPRGSSLVAFKSVAETFNNPAFFTEGSDGGDHISKSLTKQIKDSLFRKLYNVHINVDINTHIALRSMYLRDGASITILLLFS